MDEPRVCVVVVSFNTCDKLRRCLACIEPHHEIVVVDNNSRDGSANVVVAEFPHVRLIRNGSNAGFGVANNQGINAARSRYVLLLNSDAYADLGAIDRLADTLDARPDAVACGGSLRNPDGSRQNSTANALTLWAVFCEQMLLEKLFPRSPVFSPYWITPSNATISPTVQLMGACLMLRPVERFDERFFLYCEDTELCLRLRRHGELLFVPQAGFVHDLGSSTSANRWRAVAFYNRGKELYFQIHRGPTAFGLCWLLNRSGALIRLALWGIPALFTLGLVPRLRRQTLLFWKVLAAPVSGPRVPQPTPEPS